MITLPSARRIATPTELAFSCMFGLQPLLASLLAQMFAGAAVKALRTHIHRLRQALTEEAIDTTSDGYALTEVGQGECEQALVDFRAWIEGERAA
jgi:hypothetical protein